MTRFSVTAKRTDFPPITSCIGEEINSQFVYDPMRSCINVCMTCGIHVRKESVPEFKRANELQPYINSILKFNRDLYAYYFIGDM